MRHTATINVNSNAKGLQIVKQRNLSKERAYAEIEELLGSSANDNGDEVAQFQADRFIADQFCMAWPKPKLHKRTIQVLPETVAFQEQMRCFSPYEMDNNHNRQVSGLVDDANPSPVGLSQNSQSNESKIQTVDLTGIRTKEVDSLLKESFEAYQLGQYGLAAAKYKIVWEALTDATLKSRVEHINEDVVCYMLCLSLLETDQLNNLLEAVDLLVALEKRSLHRFPAVYYALSMAHHKHYRFALALKVAKEGLAFLDGDVELTEQKIPGTDVTLKESTKDGLSVSLAAMKDESSKWHPPDAVCCMSECLPSSHSYGPNRDIYFRDPAFNGMVVLTCSNSRNPCTMKFHQACWKIRKDQLSALKKLSDKDIIGYECFTPNCEYGQGTRSIIIRVEVYGDDGQLKTHIEPPTNPVQWTKRRPVPKGAIPKQQIKPKRQSEKIRRPVTIAVPRSSCKEVMGENRAEKAWRMVKLAKLRQNNFGIKPACEWRPDMEMYGNPQMMEIGDFLGGPIFENGSPKLVAIKKFIFTYFYEFIKENGCVKRIEISQKWEEDKFIFDNHGEALQGETDIWEFLLQSYKLVSLGDRIGIAENLPELYAIVRSEVCACLKFLLADPLHSRPAHLQDDISDMIINDREQGENPNNHPECSENDSFRGEPGIDSNGHQISSQLILNTEEKGDLAELCVNSGEGMEVSDGACNLPQEFVFSNGLQESESGQDYQIHDLDSADCKLDGTTDSMSETNWGRHEMEPTVDATVAEPKCITTYDDAAEQVEPCDKEHPALGTGLPIHTKEDSVDFKRTKTIETAERMTITLPLPKCQDILAESNVQKIENDLAVMVKTVAQLKSVLEQNQARSENHAQILEQELMNHKTVSQQSMTELVKDLSRLEARYALLELEKSEIMHKFKQCELDLRRVEDENVNLTLRNTELTHKYNRLSEEKADIDHNFDLLTKEKSVIENSLEIVQRERDKMDKKLQKYHARSKDKSIADSEQMSCLQKEQSQLAQQILDAKRFSERRLKLQSLNHEFNINKYAIERAFEKCHDYISMLNDVSELVKLITGQQFIMGEVQAPWQQTKYYLNHTIEKYKEDYSKLHALLDSDKEIDNLNDIKLPTLNIVLPQPPNLAELYRKGEAKLTAPQMPVLPSPWLMPGGHYQAPGYFYHPANAYFQGRNLTAGVNDTNYIPVGSGFSNNHCSQKFYPNDHADNASQRAQGDDMNGSGFRRGESTIQPEPISIADTKSSDENSTLYDGEGDDKGVSHTSCGTNALEGSPQIPVNRQSGQLKKVGRDALMQELRKKFVGVPELDLLESIQNVRRLHNGTLSGMRVQDIIRESEPIVMQLQAKHLAHYMSPKQMLPPERIPLRQNKPSQRKLPSSMPLGQQKKIRGGAQEQANNPGIKTKVPTVVPAVVPAAMRKPAWAPVASGLVEWKKKQEDAECTICFESMNTYDKRAPVYILPCQHSFHTACIKKWLGETSVCPICRIHCTMDDEFPPLP